MTLLLLTIMPYRAVLIVLSKSSATVLIVLIVVSSCTEAIFETNRPVINVNGQNSKLADRVLTLFNIPSTTCETITVNKTAGKRSIDERTVNPELDRRSKRTLSVENDDDFENFLTVDEEQLSEDLINAALTTDGSGDTPEPSTTPSTTMTQSTLLTTSTTMLLTTTKKTPLGLTGSSQFLINILCTNASDLLDKIQQALNGKLVFNLTNVLCPRPRSLFSDTLQFTILTENNIVTLNTLFRLLSDEVSELGYNLQSIDRCYSDDLVIVRNVTACYLIDFCNLCGDRGECDAEKNVTKCQCFNNSTITYTDDLCSIPKENPLTSGTSSGTLIAIGVLAGLTGVFCLSTSYLLFMSFRRRRRQRQLRAQQQLVPDSGEVRMHRSWHLPRVQLPTVVTAGNRQTNTEYYSMTSSDQEQYDSIDSSFFHELDEQLQRNGSMTSTRSNSNSPIASSLFDLTTSPPTSNYDPILELDIIFNNDNSTSISDESLYELFEDDRRLTVVNPHFELPNLNNDSQ